MCGGRPVLEWVPSSFSRYASTSSCLCRRACSLALGSAALVHAVSWLARYRNARSSRGMWVACTPAVVFPFRPAMHFGVAWACPLMARCGKGACRDTRLPERCPCTPRFPRPWRGAESQSPVRDRTGAVGSHAAQGRLDGDGPRSHRMKCPPVGLGLRMASRMSWGSWGDGAQGTAGHLRPAEQHCEGLVGADPVAQYQSLPWPVRRRCGWRRLRGAWEHVSDAGHGQRLAVAATRRADNCWSVE